MGGGKPTRGLPKPPPPLWRPSWVTPHVESRQIGSPKCPNESPEWGARVREGGRANCHFSNNSTMKQYFKMFIFAWRCVFLALSLLQYQNSPISFLRAVMRENMVAYIVNRAYNRHQIWSPGLSRLHSILQATSLGKTVYTRTKSATTTHME